MNIYTFAHLKRPLLTQKITRGNCGFHATICLSSNKGVSQSFIFFGLKHSGLLFPACCNCSNSRMFFDALIFLSIQHNLHSLSLQRCNITNYVYLIQEREFIKTKEENNTRFNLVNENNINSIFTHFIV